MVSADATDEQAADPGVAAPRGCSTPTDQGHGDTLFVAFLFSAMTPRASYRLPLPGGRALELGERTLVMGILNMTPDSFSDGGAHLDVERAVAAGLRMVEDGADILDIGGESSAACLLTTSSQAPRGWGISSIINSNPV